MNDAERQIAGAFANAFEVFFGFHPGGLTERDALDQSGLRVDCTFDGPTPPIALEITSIPLQPLIETSGAMRHVDQNLSEFVKREQLGRFTVAVRAGADLKRVRSEVEALMRELAASGGFRL